MSFLCRPLRKILNFEISPPPPRISPTEKFMFANKPPGAYSRIMVCLLFWKKITSLIKTSLEKGCQNNTMWLRKTLKAMDYLSHFALSFMQDSH